MSDVFSMLLIAVSYGALGRSRRRSLKMVILNISQKSQENTCPLNKVAGVRSTVLLKRNSGTCIFLWVLRNFKERLFYRTPLVATSFLFNNISWKNLILNSLSQTSYFSEKINLAFAFINYFYASIQFCTPWKRQKKLCLGDIEKRHWSE